MPKIIWKGIIKSENEFPAADIPLHARKLDGEEDMGKMQIKALPFMIPSVLLCFLCMFLKTYMANQRVIHVAFLFIGVVIGFFLLIVHEVLHAIAFPSSAVVYIGIMPKSFAPVALSSSPVKRNRYIFISILPILLGLIPLGIFCVSNPSLRAWNGVLFGMAIMGMVSVYPDIYNIFHIIRVVPRHAILQNDKNQTYYYESQPEKRNETIKK